ncbi:hypothetical protein Abu_0920 [Aliarcobacter butzleri RM4018]|uniref:Uncharacterized protein n=2 Tax=Aliarcobacter butzleri TaxID=28197 RepID=A8ETA6_ALIB4|nr:hypothetical protein Abu_0920 [Aliarcobacter butzleri RM4018]
MARCTWSTPLPNFDKIYIKLVRNFIKGYLMSLDLFSSIVLEIVRSINGKLYTDEEIKNITKGATGKYLKEFFPSSQDELAAKNRVEAAKKHIEAASNIIRDIQDDLYSQDKQLNDLIDTISEKKKLADRYQTLANTNKEAFEAFKVEMEEALKHELIEQENKGKRLRQLVSLGTWLVTLILGAALGTYFKDIIEFIK